MTPKKSSPEPQENLFLVYGTDDLSALRKADALAETLCPPEQQDFGLEIISPESGVKLADACVADLRRTIEAILTPSFLGGSKTVYLRNANFFDPLTEPGKFEAVKTEVARLTDLLKKGLPEDVSLIVLTPKIHKATAFFKCCKEKGEVFAFDEPEKDKDIERDFVPRVREQLKEAGLTMSPRVMEAFLSRTGARLRQVNNEIEKLSLYLGDRTEVTIEDIDLMVATVRENKFYEYADAFCSGDLPRTLQILQRMEVQNESPVGLLVNLQTRLAELLVLRDCLDRGWLVYAGGKWARPEWRVPPENEPLLAALEKDPRQGNPFAIGMRAAQAQRFSVGRWFRWLKDAVDTQAAMTGGEALRPELALELFTTRALGRNR